MGKDIANITLIVSNSDSMELSYRERYVTFLVELNSKRGQETGNRGRYNKPLRSWGIYLERCSLAHSERSEL